MENHNSRSLNVVNAFKRHKIAISALRKIARTIRGFEEEHRANWKIARVGMVLIMLMLMLAAYYFFNRAQVTLPL